MQRRPTGLHVMLTSLGPAPGLDGLAHPFRPVDHEVGMVKAALLYADHVTVASPPVGRLAMMAAASKAAADDDLPRLRGLMRALRRADGLPLDEGNDDVAMAVARQYGNDVTRVLDHEPAWIELFPAIDRGLVKIEPLAGGKPLDTLAAMLHVLDHGRGVAPGWLTMVDDGIAEVIRTGVKLGFPTPRSLAGATEVALANEVIATIPAFPEARMDVLLDARERLREPLVRFRAGMATYARDIAAAPTDPDFRREAAALYREKIEPELLALQELGQEQKIWPALRREVAESHGGRVVSATAGLVLATAAGLPAVLQAAVTIAALGADVAGGLAKRMHDLGEARGQYGALWLFEARRLISQESHQKRRR
jgi:hypothetical protein